MKRLGTLAHLVWPKRCPGCKGVNRDRDIFCPPCSSTLIAPTTVCSTCGKKLRVNLDKCDLCQQKQSQLKSYAWSFEHGAAAQNAIHELKYRNGVWIASGLASFLDPKSVHSSVNLVIPVPLSARRLRQRHYNQSALIAKHLAKRLSIPISFNSIVRVKDTAPQVGLSASQRLSNVRNAFHCPKTLKNKHILLVDDVSTTGATLQSCAQTLRRSGAESINAWTFTRDE